MEKLFFNKGLIRVCSFGKGLEFEFGNCLWKGLLLFWASRAALAQLAAIVSPANKPTKVKWSLSWSRALENCGEAVL